jgi:hypothetical protein
LLAQPVAPQTMAGIAPVERTTPQLIDQRGIAKVPTFSGRRDQFEEWIFPFESYCGLLGWETYLDSAKAMTTEIELLSLSTEAEGVGRSLYQLLVSTTKGTALSIVRPTQRGNGLEAFRKLMSEYRPHLNEEHGVMLQMILTPAWWPERLAKQNFTEVLIAWDEMIARYEQASGEKVSNNMKTSTVMAHAPDAVKTLLRAAPAEVRKDHSRMRSTIFEAIIGRQRGACTLPPMFDGGSKPMEVDAIWGKSGGKGGKKGHPTTWGGKDCGKGACKGKDATTKGGLKGGKGVGDKFDGK